MLRDSIINLLMCIMDVISFNKYEEFTQSLPFNLEKICKNIRLLLGLDVVQDNYEILQDNKLLYDNLEIDKKDAYDFLQKESTKINLLMSSPYYLEYLKKIFGNVFCVCLDNISITDSIFLKNFIFTIGPNIYPNYQIQIQNHIAKKSLNITKLYDIIEKCKIKKYLITNNFIPIIFGCPKSTDIDVAIFLNKEDYDNIDINIGIEINILNKILDDLGYDMAKDVDINYVYLNDDKILYSKKGCPKETSNIIYSTYQYHKQRYPCPILKYNPINIMDRLDAVLRFILMELKYLIGKKEYMCVKPKRDDAFTNGNDKPNLVLSILDKIYPDDSQKINKKYLDVIKSLSIKIIQLIIMYNNDEQLYTKDQLAIAFGKYYPIHSENIKWFLFRGTVGIYNNDCLFTLLYGLGEIIKNLTTIK